MFRYDLDKMLYTIRPEENAEDNVRKILAEHPEVKFVSLTGVDLGSHNTDEKIPIRAFLQDMEKILKDGVQTDGSSVALPKIAELSNARVDILPDREVNWYVEYSFQNIDYKTGLPTGTLRIPSYLRHNGDRMVGSRIFNRRTTKSFRRELLALLHEYPYVFEHIGGVNSADEIEDIVLTSATELEFWVKTPEDRADRDQLFTSQELKEQYWKRTVGPVGKALEETLEVLDKYGFEVEMGHKEVGGVRAKLMHSGDFDHIMEQLEIDWKYAVPMQAADNESQIKHIIRDIFLMNNLEVTFLAKPIDGVAGNGEHTHFGVTARLKSGKVVNLFEPADRTRDFMSPIGYGALMGLLRNYEILNPFIAATQDAFLRLKPGFEAPVCIVTSLGRDYRTPSRNRTVLVGLIRDLYNPLATRFELRSPHPHSNTYLLTGAGYKVMLDGIRAVLASGKTPQELERSISKAAGEADFYLEADREYRSEENVFTFYTPEERERLFGRAPATVWENFRAFDTYADKLGMITGGDETLALIIESYRAQMTSKWITEFRDRRIQNAMDFVRRCSAKHSDEMLTDLDEMNWNRVSELRRALGKDYIGKTSLLTDAKAALDREDYDTASDLELVIQDKIEELRQAYNEYRKNLF
ncbi:MAG: glutamine synthetase [Mogibacterium sp.]|nr:glutamine synthetase [Mogibacterium sp.]